jgi:hypothetical protein
MFPASLRTQLYGHYSTVRLNLIYQALNPVKAYGQDIDDEELYSMLANRFNPHHEEDAAFNYFEDDTSDDEELVRKLTKPIGRAGGVFVTPEGRILS